MQTQSKLGQVTIGKMEDCVRPIRTEQDYRHALEVIDSVIDAPDDSPGAELRAVLSVLVADYEDKNHPIEAPDPIAFLEFVIESRGLTRKDLEPYIGSAAQVEDVMAKRRALSLRMIRRLAASLKLPADVLIQPYPLASPRSAA